MDSVESDLRERERLIPITQIRGAATNFYSPASATPGPNRQSQSIVDMRVRFSPTMQRNS
jgi:hypothetical protein